MCQPNKYLRGSLIYLPNLKAIAAIGHCCADKDNIVAASREYRERTTRDVEHDYLLAHIPLIPAQLSVLQQVRPAARAAERIYRDFRRAGRPFQRPLRLVKKSGGLLALEEQMQTQADAAGPAAFRSRVNIQKIEFGFLRGMIALTGDYNPVREVDKIAASLRPHSYGKTDDALLDYVAMLEPPSRHTAFVQARQAGINYSKFQRRIADFCDFFTQQNIQLLNQWASHPANPHRFEASLRGNRCTFRRPGEFWSIPLDPVLWAYNFQWPKPVGD
jgi:hypothetical protein